jgi:hypothetical protein
MAIKLIDMSIISFFVWFILTMLALFCAGRMYVMHKEQVKEEERAFNNAYFNVNIAIVTAEINDQQYRNMQTKIWSLRQMKRANQELIDVLVAKADRKFMKL